jgi:hypothetical protein
MATTISCPIPSDINPLSPNGFRFEIIKLPEVTYFCQQVNLPGIMLGAPELANPFRLEPVPGESITYDQLSVQFLIDTSMANYRAIYNWMIALGFPQDYEQYKDLVGGDQTSSYLELSKNYSQATLQILDNLNSPVATIQFQDLFPISLESLVLASSNTDVNYMVGSATFRYGYYKFLD